MWCSYFPVDQPYSGRSLGLNSTSLLNPDDLSGQSPLPQFLFASVEKVLEIRFKTFLKDRSSKVHAQVELMVVDESHTVGSLDRQKVCSTITLHQKEFLELKSGSVCVKARHPQRNAVVYRMISWLQQSATTSLH